MYDVPGRVNNLYKDPQVPYELEAEPETVDPGYPPQCEFTRATGAGTAQYCEAFGAPPQLASAPRDTTWIWSLICVGLLILVARS